MQLSILQTVWARNSSCLLITIRIDDCIFNTCFDQLQKVECLQTALLTFVHFCDELVKEILD